MSLQLYHSDPSGNYSGWKATCIGNNHSAATSLLTQEYKTQEETSIQVESFFVPVVPSSFHYLVPFDEEKFLVA